MVRNYKPTGKPVGRPRKDGRPPKRGGYRSKPKETSIKAAREPKPPPSAEYLGECFRRDGDILVWKARPASHFKDARKPDAMTLFNEKFPGKVAGYKPVNGRNSRVTIEGRDYSVEKVIETMKEAGL